MEVTDFDFNLPPDLIAQEPPRDRESSRLLLASRSGGLNDSIFRDLPSHLHSGDVLVCNESRVIPARIAGRLPTGGSVEVLLVRREGEGTWEAMTKPARKLHPGVKVELPAGGQAVIREVRTEGRRLIELDHPQPFDDWLEAAGSLPIPPYIKQYPADPDSYQTVYAEERGSIAAPTAGLHFTKNLLDRLRTAGVEVHFVTLHVGPGTFKPVHEIALADIRLEPELGSLSASAAQAISLAKVQGRRIVAVGTTTTRLLEGVYRSTGELMRWSGEVDVFISPPFAFQVVDVLITNFHLPRSTLLMLVSAFAGWDRIRAAYEHAIKSGYKFYSFGDAMLIEKAVNPSEHPPTS